MTKDDDNSNNRSSSNSIIPKKDLEKTVRAGVWIQVRWDDVPDMVCLVTRMLDPWRTNGDVSMDVMYYDSKQNKWMTDDITHRQIVHVFTEAKLQPPALFNNNDDEENETLPHSSDDLSAIAGAPFESVRTIK